MSSSPSPFRRHLLRIVAPAIAVTAVGLVLLFQQYRFEMSRRETLRQARMLVAADELRDAVREAGVEAAARRAVLDTWPQGQTETDLVRPIGAFVWEPRKGLVWSRGGTDALWTRLKPRIYWT